MEKQNLKTYLEDYNMLKTYKILSILLDYPTEDTVKVLPSVMPILEEEKLLNRVSLRNMLSFLENVEKQDLLEWKEKYTSQFDYAAATSLYLFDHVYGDSKKRGMAMVDLKQLYASEGMEISSGELPDYLPVLLEFIANSQTHEQGADLLAETGHVLKKIETNLKEGNSPYSYLISILIYLASKGSVQPLTEEEKIEIEHMHACEACFFNAADVEQEEL
ncbi:MAG: nitrate reductase molybdenum cofactor assembly chaperone [Bacteroidales bacterium]